jgi:glucokinase
MLLAGDLGGTKTVLAVYSAESGSSVQVIQKSYPSAKYSSLEAMVQEFLETIDVPIDGACFAVAGPVFLGRAHITNLLWVIDAVQLKLTFGWEYVDLMNDLEAVAYAIPILHPEDIYDLSAGKPVPGGNISVVAPGTGLGEAYLTFDNDRYTAHGSEGSHTDFAPVDSIQMDLLKYMWEKKGFKHVSYEWVCSGLGIPYLYSFLKDSGCGEEPAWLAAALAESDDPTPVIFNNAQRCELCQATLDLFIAILGAEAGNQALKVMATGGIYLGGGIPPRIVTKLLEPSFLEALRSKGRFREILSNIPVRIILNPLAGMKGAAAFSFDRHPVPNRA